MIVNNSALNVLGKKLEKCCDKNKTGYLRDGYCNIDHNDYGQHIICAIMTEEFLQFSKKQGNDLTQPIKNSNFPGLVAGDCWCLCISRWIEALEHNVAPQVILKSSHIRCLDYVSINILKKFSYQNV